MRILYRKSAITSGDLTCCPTQPAFEVGDGTRDEVGDGSWYGVVMEVGMGGCWNARLGRCWKWGWSVLGVGMGRCWEQGWVGAGTGVGVGAGSRDGSVGNGVMASVLESRIVGIGGVPGRLGSVVSGTPSYQRSAPRPTHNGLLTWVLELHLATLPGAHRRGQPARCWWVVWSGI